MSSEIPTPSYEEMTPEQRSLAIIHGVNQLIRQMRLVLETKTKVDNCPHCQHPERISAEIAELKQSGARGKLFFIGLVLASTGTGSGITKLVEALTR